MSATTRTPANPRDRVVCALHGAPRKAGYCDTVPIYNAKQEVVEYKYHCKEGDRCSRSGGGAGADAHKSGRSGDGGAEPATRTFDGSSSSTMKSSNNNERSSREKLAASKASGSTIFSVSFHAATTTGEEATTATLARAAKRPRPLEVGEEEAEGEGVKDVVDEVVVEEDVAPATKQASSPSTSFSPTNNSRAPLRYYELLQRGGTNSAMVRKVCWNCGMSGHERPDCPNALCRSCHGRRLSNQAHLCRPVQPSPFIVMSRTLPQGEVDMPAVRCIVCGEMGHFDCGGGRALAASSAAEGAERDNNPRKTCAYCGMEGHTAYSCHQRDRMFPDRWVMQQLGGSSGGGMGGRAPYTHNSHGDGPGVHRRGSPPHHGEQQHRGGGSYGDAPYRRGEGYNNNSRGGDGFNRGGYNNNRGDGYNRESYNNNNRGGDGYNRGGYNNNNRGDGYNRESYNNNNNSREGYTNNSRGGYNRGGDGYNREGYNNNRGGDGYNNNNNNRGGDSYNNNNNNNRGGDSYNRGHVERRDGNSSYGRGGGSYGNNRDSPMHGGRWQDRGEGRPHGSPTQRHGRHPPRGGRDPYGDEEPLY